VAKNQNIDIKFSAHVFYFLE